MEGLVGGNGQSKPHCGSSERLHGAGLPTRRPSFPLEQPSPGPCWQRCCLRSQGQADPNRSPDSQEVWDWVRYLPWTASTAFSAGLLSVPRPDTKLLTKGDNNNADDTELFAKGQDYLGPEDIVGGVVGYIPFVGYVTILLSEYPWLKTAMLGLMGLLVVLQRE